jgi:phosphopantothenoylcysteine decarboxylase/phosphopantothenate--cysteine ligase
VPPLALIENPDILATVGHDPDRRPRLVVGFAAETNDLVANAGRKLVRKGADWILANDVSPETGIMGGDRNTIRLVSRDGVEDWPNMDKTEVARRLVARIVEALGDEKTK